MVGARNKHPSVANIVQTVGASSGIVANIVLTVDSGFHILHHSITRDAGNTQYQTYVILLFGEGCPSYVDQPNQKYISYWLLAFFATS